MFRDRKDSGQQLAKRLGRYAHGENAIVLGLPRGGVVTAFEVASALDLPLDVLVVRKLGTPRCGDRPPLEIKGRPVILVDDGLATGSTMFAAVRMLQSHNPARIVIAVPVAPPDTIERLRHEADELVCLMIPRTGRVDPKTIEPTWCLDARTISSRCWRLRSRTIPSAKRWCSSLRVMPAIGASANALPR